MAQVFSHYANAATRVVIFATVVVVFILFMTWYVVFRSPYVTDEGVPKVQPVQFSHGHHVGQVGIDCRYCHHSVEYSRFAGIPSTKTCMGCHAHLWTQAAELEPVRESYRTNSSLLWVRINDLPDFVYFHHGAHVVAGVGCESCHGRVDKMPLTWRAASLDMEWCLQCHRNPSPHLRPQEEVYTMGYTPSASQTAAAQQRFRALHIETPRLMDCSTCHR